MCNSPQCCAIPHTDACYSLIYRISRRALAPGFTVQPDANAFRLINRSLTETVQHEPTISQPTIVSGRHAASRAALAKAYKNLQIEGVKNVHYLAGELLLSNDDEATTDGSHPSDLGMAQYADAYQSMLQKILS